MSKPNIVLITGGGGYLGSMLAKGIAGDNVIVYLADIQFNRQAEQLSLAHENVSRIHLDLRQYDETASIVQNMRPDYVFHFASRIDRIRDFSVFESMSLVNVTGTFNLLNALTHVDYKMFAFSSTSEAYGTSNALPFHEAQLTHPVSPYSLTKVMAEKLIETWGRTYHKPWQIFRIFNFYGPGMPSTTFIPDLMQTLGKGQAFHMTPGEQKRDYLYIDDLVWYIKNLVLSEVFNQEVINLCSGRAVSMLEIADLSRKTYFDKAEIFNDLPYRSNEIWEIRGSNKKIKEAFPHYEPIEFLQGLNTMMDDRQEQNH